MPGEKEGMRGERGACVLSYGLGENFRRAPFLRSEP